MQLSARGLFAATVVLAAIIAFAACSFFAPDARYYHTQEVDSEQLGCLTPQSVPDIEMTDVQDQSLYLALARVNGFLDSVTPKLFIYDPNAFGPAVKKIINELANQMASHDELGNTEQWIKVQADAKKLFAACGACGSDKRCEKKIQKVA